MYKTIGTCIFIKYSTKIFVVFLNVAITCMILRLFGKILPTAPIDNSVYM